MQLEEDFRTWGDIFLEGEVFICFNDYHCMFFRPSPTYIVLPSYIRMKRVEEGNTIFTPRFLANGNSLGVKWTWGGNIRVENGNDTIIDKQYSTVFTPDNRDQGASWKSHGKAPLLFIRVCIFGFLRRHLLKLESSESVIHEITAIDLFSD